MNRAQQALYEIKEMDELAMMDSPVHHFSALSKLAVTVIYIITVMSFDNYAPDRILMMALYPYVLFQITGIPFRTCVHKMKWVLPLVCAIGIFNPFFDKKILLRIGTLSVTGGMLSFIAILIKGVLCVTASFLLAATVRIDDLCGAMRKIHIPSMLVTVFMLTYRYLGVLTEEAAIMSDAYHLRCPDQKGIHYTAWGSFLGQLILRSMDRAEELYAAMELRGYHGEFPASGNEKINTGSLLYALGWTALFLLLRFFNIPAMIGNLFIR